MILTTIAQEKKRIEYMLAKYQEEYDRLPKGSLSERKTGGKSYYYLKYRDGKKLFLNTSARPTLMKYGRNWKNASTLKQ